MLLESIIIGIIVGYIKKGKLSSLASANIKHTYLVFIATAIEYGLLHLLLNFNFITKDVSFLIIILQYLCIFIFIWFNRRYQGMLIAGMGILLNFLVISANGGAMPLSNHVLSIAGQSNKITLLKEGRLFTYTLIEQKTPLWLLGDIFYVPFPIGEFISIGDIVMAIGIVFFIQKAMVENTHLNSRY